MTLPPARVWRVFPWSEAAAEGELYSPSYVPPLQGKGRFDLPGVPGGVLYLSESPDHAVAEHIQHYRNGELDEADLIVAGQELALVAVSLPDGIRKAIVDLCDPAILNRLRIGPDRLASGDRASTQAIAASLASEGYNGLRWWSALSGDWHTVVLFRNQLNGTLEFGTPERIYPDHPSVVAAARELGVRLPKR